MARGVAIPPWTTAAILIGGLATVLAGLASALAETGTETAAAAPPERLCAEAIAREEQRTVLPARLLLAIAIAESGRYDRARRAIVAWPWTVRAEGRGRYLKSASEATAAVRALLARGVDSVDVGCMQINLHYHPDAFATIEDAFDPTANVAYAAAFLNDLAGRTGSWFAAIGRYHSSTPDHGRRYRAKVLRIRKAQHRRAGAGYGLPEIESPAIIAPARGLAPGLPIVIRGASGETSSARIFAPERNALPMVLRGAAGVGRSD